MRNGDRPRIALSKSLERFGSVPYYDPTYEYLASMGLEILA
jgi:hypothetical protein